MTSGYLLRELFCKEKRLPLIGPSDKKAAAGSCARIYINARYAHSVHATEQIRVKKTLDSDPIRCYNPIKRGNRMVLAYSRMGAYIVRKKCGFP